MLLEANNFEPWGFQIYVDSPDLFYKLGHWEDLMRKHYIIDISWRH